ncbi:Cation channel sperm-associated protein 2 [Clydaea vesicula]|uniref:Cation channel sperm-associated protein 2 n=1 Tax=Clydaea vesicula TaxID=447962 RepID=A0AAD5U3R7_9FUNG|nr:Cation channel sperm-associated protein 2 [Clydaea vesicula]
MDTYNQKKKNINDAFHDLSTRSEVFRTKLIDEFQLLDNISQYGLSVKSPLYTSNDFTDQSIRQQLLSENPNHLIKFKVFKRSKHMEQDTLTDRRLTRTKNRKYLPIGAWAGSVVQSDLLITIITLLPEVLELFVESHQKGNTFTTVIHDLRALRILRTLKIVASFGNLKLIVLCILEAFKRKNMSYIMSLVFMVAFIYALVGINIYYEYSISKDSSLSYQFYFQNTGSILMCLFQLLTLDKWDNVTNPVLSYIYIISWVFLGSFIFRNIFIGVMVNNFDKMSEEINEKRIEYLKNKKFNDMKKKLNKQLEAAKSNFKNSMNNLNEEEVKLNKTVNEEENVDKLILTIQQLMIENQGNSEEWEEIVKETMTALLAGKQSDVMWPRDTLFKYLQTMETLQENMKEYQELQNLLNWAILELHDT